LQANRGELAIAALKKTAGLYPCLESGQQYSWQSGCRSVVVACQYPPADWLGSRQYVSDTDQVAVLYDGLPVDGSDRIAAHNASDLARHWNELAENLDGFYCCIRLRKKELQLELQLDSFGVYPVFYWTDGTVWLISNSVALLDQLTGERELDAVGVSRFLAMGWVTGNRTLRKEVRVFPAGERWTWSKDRPNPTKRHIIEPRALAQKQKSRLTQSQVVELGEGMARPLMSLGRHFDNILCPLTGGKDSRVLATLLTYNNVIARYYTYGNKVGSDAEIASQIAGILGVDHETVVTESLDLLANWDDTVKSLVLQGDGMCGLQLAMGVVTAQKVTTRPIPVRIWGAGGEVGRADYFNPLQDVRGTSVREIQTNIAHRIIDSANGMIHPDACSLARSFIDESIVKYADDGFHVDDLNDVFFLYERGGRRVGQNMRATMSLRDSYSPFYCRSFVEAAFSLDARSRRTEPLHYRLIEEFAPAVLKVPFDKGRWRSRSPLINVSVELAKQIQRRLTSGVARRLPWANGKGNRHILVKDTMFERVTWLQEIQKELRESCLDQRSSEIWNFVDREKFAAATAPSDLTGNLLRNPKTFFLVATLYYYESLTKTSPTDVLRNEA